VESSRKPPTDRAQLLNPAIARAAVDVTSRALRLIPFPAADTSSLQMPLMQLGQDFSSPAAVTGMVPPAGGQEAAAIVSKAAAILDEEMARGVLAARSAKPFTDRRDADSNNTVLRQAHDLIDNFARLWPGVQNPSPAWPGATATTPAGTGADDALPTLKPANVLRPGAYGTFSMMLCNNEDRPVRLTPAATDLIGSEGGRIPSPLITFEPGEVRLEPGAQQEMHGRIAVPVDTVADCYIGLLVVTGVDYLRALIAIEVG
jgi:hypothetical protein